MAWSLRSPTIERNKSTRKGEVMKQKRILAMSILAAAWLAFNTTQAWAQAAGTSKTEPQSDTDVTKGAGKSGQSQSSPGLSQSQREGGASKTSKTEPQSDRDVKTSGTGTSQDRSVSGGQGMANVKQAQEALKSAGHDPGPIDGKMGPQTRQALKAFQSSNGLKETGSLDAETSKKLGVSGGGSASGASSSGAGSSAGREPSGTSGSGASKGQGSSTQREPSSPTTK
jgi:hypothetical protein